MNEKDFREAEEEWLERFNEILPFVKEGKEQEAREAWLKLFHDDWIETRLFDKTTGQE